MNEKLMFSGPVGAGKTAAIRSISDIPVIAAETAAADASTARRPSTAATMDYGAVELDDGGKVHLYGLPGQDRFRYIWDSAVPGGTGLIFLFDNAREDPLADLGHYLGALKTLIAGIPVAIGVTRTDIAPKPRLPAYRTKIDEQGISAPVFEVDARKRADVKTLLLALLATVDPGLGWGAPKQAEA